MNGNLYLDMLRPIEDSNFRTIMGIRFDEEVGKNARIYVGTALTNTTYDDVDEYASVILGDGFSELQVGANFPLSDRNYLNLNYRHASGMGDKKRFGIGFITSID